MSNKTLNKPKQKNQNGDPMVGVSLSDIVIIYPSDHWSVVQELP